MQTPGLPAWSASTRNNNAENFFSEKPANARDHFGDLMNRALHSGTGILPVSSGSHGQDARATIDHDADENHDNNNSSALKSRKPLRKTLADSAAANVSANPHFIAAHTNATAPTPTQPSGNSHESPATGDSIIPLSAETANTTVANADTSETNADDSTAKPIPAGMQPHSAETSDSTEHAQNPPTTDIAKALATQAAEATADAAKPTVSDDSDSPLTQSADSKSAVEPVSAFPPGPHGIPAAKQDMTMKKAEKMQKVAGSAEQDLPGNTASGSEELPKGQKISEKAASHGEKADSTAIELPTRISTSVESPSTTITSAGPTPSASLDTRVLERTHDIVALHAMRLTDTGAETLHIVVKPGAGIQLSLELRQSARGIEVSASLHKGDYDQLNQHWPELQQRLEARGVRVSTLTPSENYTGTNHQFNQSKQQSSQQESLHAGAFAEFALAGSMTEAPGARAARASAYRGWETWA
jgi:hypothetical protein